MDDQSVGAVFENQQICLEKSVDWPEGTRLMVIPMIIPSPEKAVDGRTIIVGFGLPGRCVADLLDQAKLPYTIIEKNPVTVTTQQALGRNILLGDAADPTALVRAGLNDAAVLALTIPDEEAVLSAISLARRLRPNIFIIARTNYASQGMKAKQLGADEVIKAEQSVAVQFYERLSRRLRRTMADAAN